MSLSCASTSISPILRNPRYKPLVKSMATERSSVLSVTPPMKTAANTSAFEVRLSLVFALASQSSALSQRILMDLANETAKYIFPSRRFEARTLEEALMSVPDLETVNFKVLSRNDQYEIREVQPYFIAETTMPGRYGFDLSGASQSFNVLADYLFGKNTKKEKMEMTTPVFTNREKSEGQKLDMTTPVITRKTSKLKQLSLKSQPKRPRSKKLMPTLEVGTITNYSGPKYRRDHCVCAYKADGQDKWKMSFVMPSKYGSDLPLPQDSKVTIREVPKKIVAVVAFSGFISDEEVKRRESRLRDALKRETEYRIKEGASVEVAQYNPPFTLPFTRRNEIALEVERKHE